MTSIGDFVIVDGISQKGKNRIQEHGMVWKVIKTLGLARVLLESTDEAKNWRWVDVPEDVDFCILKIVNPDNL